MPPKPHSLSSQDCEEGRETWQSRAVMLGVVQLCVEHEVYTLGLPLAGANPAPHVFAVQSCGL